MEIEDELMLYKLITLNSKTHKIMQSILKIFSKLILEPHIYIRNLKINKEQLTSQTPRGKISRTVTVA